MAMSPGVKERLEVVYDIAKTTFHWGFIPVVLYLGKTFGTHGYLCLPICRVNHDCYVFI